MIKNIIFDLGGVIFDFNPLEYMELMGFSLEQGKLYQNIIWNSKEWHLMDLGKISYEELIESLCKKNPEYAKDLEYLLKNRTNKYILKQNDKNARYVKKLVSLGFRIYFLSNVTAVDLEYNANSFDVFNLISGAVYSCLCGYAKPSDEIFQELLSTYSLNSDECVFIDDLEINCQGALKNGIKSILYQNPEQLQNDLNNLLNIEGSLALKLKKPNNY